MKNTAALLLLMFFTIPAYPAWLNNIPQTLTQPDGTTLHVFASGDEYYHWLHDKDGYTIVKDTNTGYYTYAEKKNGSLVSSGKNVGETDPATLQIPTRLTISKSLYLQKRERIELPIQKFNAKIKALKITDATENIHTGDASNILIFIKFDDGNGFTRTISDYDDFLNTGDPSMKNYYEEVSYQNLELTTYFYPQSSSNTIVSYTDSHERAYFQPYNSSTNPDGYQNDNQYTSRLLTLLSSAVESVKDEIPTTLNLDKDDDGYIDMLSFVVQGSPDGWSDLLWPHMWVFSSSYVKTINGLKTGRYSMQLENLYGNETYTFCHEMFHLLGAPDLYHYEDDQSYLTPVGNWDLMESGFSHMGAWMKYRYAEQQWLTEIPEITKSGQYTLYPLSDDKANAYIIKPKSALNSEEFFVVEYRKQGGSYESNLYNTGMLLYRIDESLNGNSGGPPDEVYVYRPYGSTTENGSIRKAALSNVEGEAISDYADISAFLSDGTASGLKISDISEAVDSITFYVNMDLSHEANILSFELDELREPAIIDTTDHTILLKVERESNLASMFATVEVSEYASVNPQEKSIIDLSDSVIYTVTAEDGRTVIWTVTAEVMPNHKAEILSFDLIGVDATAYRDSDKRIITVKVPYGTGKEHLMPGGEISLYADIYPSLNFETDFTDTVYYTITAEDGEHQNIWKVKVNTNGDINAYALSELVDITTYDGTVHISSYQNNLEYAVYSLTGQTLSAGNLNGDVSVNIPLSQVVCIVKVSNDIGQVVRKIRISF